MYNLYNKKLSDIKEDQTLADYIETIKQREYERGFSEAQRQGNAIAEERYKQGRLDGYTKAQQDAALGKMYKNGGGY